VDVNGYEIALDLVPIKTKNSVLQVNFSYFTSKQTIRELSNNQEMLFADNDLLIPDFIIKKGEPVGNFYGYQFLGKASAEDIAARYDSIAILNGDKYMNLDSIPGLQPSDRTVLGNSIPKNYYNLNVSYIYKSLGIDVLWYAVSGFKKYNATRAAAVMTGLSKDAYAYIENSNLSLKNYQFYESDQFVEDASFIRLKRITLFYEPVQKVFNTANIKFSLSMENLVTFTKYKGYDPEATIFTDNNFSENGIDRGAYPNPKSLFLTVELKF
jgi:TonB-dependent starch-binding outer membrane protein SusC